MCIGHCSLLLLYILTYSMLHISSYISSCSQFYYVSYCIYIIHICTYNTRISVSLLVACCFAFFSDLGPYVDFVIHSTMTFDTDWASFYTLMPINGRATVLYRFISFLFFLFLRLLIRIHIGNTEQKNSNDRI